MGMQMKIKALAILLLLLCSASQAELVPFTASFDALRHGDKVGFAKIELRATGEQEFELRYHSKVSKFFLSDIRSEVSRFREQEQTIQPITYEYKREGTGPDKALKIEFDSDAGIATINEEDEYAIDGELDNQILRIDLPRRLKNQQALVAYQFFNYRGEKRRYQLKILGNETLVLPYGQLDTIKIEVQRESNKRQTFVWFAPSLDYNLVRLQQFKNGNEQGDLQLSGFSSDTKAAAKK